MISLELKIVIAFLLDQILGDPRCLPHPVRLMGRLALGCEVVFRRLIPWEWLAGFFSVLTVVAVVGGGTFLLVDLFSGLVVLQDIVEIYLIFTAIAARDLVRHSHRVYVALQNRDLAAAKLEVSMIVGRDTEPLDESGISRACVESVAENLVDGVTAPLFWTIIGGPVGALVYKAVNTMDSTFGYKNDRYVNFGWTAAKLDDLANWLPARITAFLIILLAFLMRLDGKGALQVWREDRYCHESPNSGHSESAFAGALGVQLGGPGYYFGRLVEKPLIGSAKNRLVARHICQANNLMQAVSIAAMLLFVGIRMWSL